MTALAASLPLAGLPVQAARVDASEHHAFWLWAGVTPQPVLAQARTLYVLQGQIDGPRRAGDPPARMQAQNPATPRLSKDIELWVVYRAQTQDWNEEEFALLLYGCDAEQLQTLGEALRSGLATLNIAHAASPTADHLTVSMGARLAKDGESSEELYRRVDSLLYQAKQAGRNHLTLG